MLQMSAACVRNVMTICHKGLQGHREGHKFMDSVLGSSTSCALLG